ncbi:hypothetical protein CR513_05859, partial [Mucuna pruriens]
MALQTWQHYLLPKEVVIHSDYKALKHLRRQGKMYMVVDAFSIRHTLITMLETKMLGLDCKKEFEPFAMCVHSAFHDFFRHDAFYLKESDYEHFFWPYMKKDVHNICERCLTCKLAKSKVSPHGLYTLLPIPNIPWIYISMDFILGLPRSKGGRDSIFVMVDKFSKMAQFIPCHKSDASHATNLFFKDVVRLHGVPRTIVSNRDTKFLRHFWSRLGTKLLFSTTCHPQIDGQNKVSLMDWEDWIPHVEFAYNRVFNSTTSYSPFELANNFNPLYPLDLFPFPILPNCANDEGLSKA